MPIALENSFIELLCADRVYNPRLKAISEHYLTMIDECREFARKKGINENKLLLGIKPCSPFGAVLRELFLGYRRLKAARQ